MKYNIGDVVKIGKIKDYERLLNKIGVIVNTSISLSGLEEYIVSVSGCNKTNYIIYEYEIEKLE